jgi:hypothetical protein
MKVMLASSRYAFNTVKCTTRTTNCQMSGSWLQILRQVAFRAGLRALPKDQRLKTVRAQELQVWSQKIRRLARTRTRHHRSRPGRKIVALLMNWVRTCAEESLFATMFCDRVLFRKVQSRTLTTLVFVFPLSAHSEAFRCDCIHVL